MRHHFALLFIAAYALSVNAADGTTDPKYMVKSDELRTGTHIRSTIGYSNLIPISKRYHEFSPDERALLRDLYVNIPEDDEPPFPSQGIAPILRDISRLISRAEMTGDVSVNVLVDASGNPSDFAFIKYPNAETAKAVAIIIGQTKFKPARCSNRPCAMEYPFRLRLVLE
jgi:hypothetical protein